MPSYLSYKAKMAALDAKNDNVESWITVKGNHIPIMKGQSKEDAVKEFIGKKNDKSLSKRESKPTSVGEATKKVVEQTKKNQETYKEHKKQETAKKIDKKLAERSNKPEHISKAIKRVEQIVKGEKESPKEETKGEKKISKATEFEMWDELDRTMGSIKEFEDQDYFDEVWDDITKRAKKDGGIRWLHIEEALMKNDVSLEAVEEIHNNMYENAVKSDLDEDEIDAFFGKEVSPKESKQENWWEPKTKEEARFWLADTLASTEGFTEENFSKQDKELLKKFDKKFGEGWWKTDEPENETKDVSGKEYVKSLSDDYWEDFDVGNTSYVAQKRDDGLLQITSVHPYDSTEYHSAYTDGENAMIIHKQQKVGEVKFKSKEQLAKELKKYDEKAKLGARILHN